MLKKKLNYIKVFGERNTGTRVLLRMLEQQAHVLTYPVDAIDGPDIFHSPKYDPLREQIAKSFDGPWHRLYRDVIRDMETIGNCPTRGWKHAAAVWNEAYNVQQAHVVFCVRNPYSWLLSLMKHSYHIVGPRPATVEEFVVRPWLTLEREEMERLVISPMELWNIKLRSYESFSAQAVQIPPQVIRLEDFVADAEGVVRGVLDGFGIPVSRMQKLAVSTKKDARTAAEISAYYAREGWRENLTSGVVETLNSQIDWEIAARHEYTWLDPQDFPETTLKN